MSKDGKEIATWTGQGVGRVASPGKKDLQVRSSIVRLRLENYLSLTT
jgi:hypothetical protein